MRKLKHIFFIFLVSLSICDISIAAANINASLLHHNEIQDSLISNQVLYNGRAWRNTFTSVKGDPYLFSKEFMNGSVIISGRTFEKNRLLYDIARDEVMILSNRNFILQINKELMQGFTLTFNNRLYHFVKFEQDSLNVLNGYLNELYNGRSGVYVKYRKKVTERIVEDKYDGFVESFRVYVMKDGLAHQVKNKKQLIDLFKDKKQQITGYIKSNKLKISGDQPESFVPVAAYYDGLDREK
jgi:hypothetical protein